MDESMGFVFEDPVTYEIMVRTYPLSSWILLLAQLNQSILFFYCIRKKL